MPFVGKLFASLICPKEPGTSAFRVGDAQLRHDLVGVMLVACPLFLRVVQVGRGAAVGIGPQQLHVVYTQLAGLHICMCPPYALHAKQIRCHAFGSGCHAIGQLLLCTRQLSGMHWAAVVMHKAAQVMHWAVAAMHPAAVVMH